MRVRWALGLLVLALAGHALAAAGYLARFEWSHRPLLVFAPHRSDPRVEVLLHRLAMRECALRDRDMVVGLIVQEGDSQLDGSRLSPATARAIRQRFAIPEGGFTVVLVGKDGGEKLRDEEMPDLDEIFGLIDGMPMRREEMLAGNRACEE